MKPPVAILIPAMRVHRMLPMIRNINETTLEPHHIYIKGTKDVVQGLASEEVTCWTDKGDTWGHRLNFMFDHTTEPYVFLGADDVLFHNGWYTEALSMMVHTDGVIAVNDLQNMAGTLALVSRRYIAEESGCLDLPGVVIHPNYHHNYSERELFETAISRHRFEWCQSSTVEHLHWLSGKAPHDDVYALGESRWGEDEEFFNSRIHMWRRT